MKFKKGQSIVCVDDTNIPSEFPSLNKGEKYTYAGNGDSNRTAMLKEFPAPAGCSTKYYAYIKTRFAPITPQYEDIRQELAANVTVGDQADQPVKVKISMDFNDGKTETIKTISPSN